jgi:hypothetical protein
VFGSLVGVRLRLLEIKLIDVVGVGDGCDELYIGLFLLYTLLYVPGEGSCRLRMRVEQIWRGSGTPTQPQTKVISWSITEYARVGLLFPSALKKHMTIELYNK